MRAASRSALAALVALAATTASAQDGETLPAEAPVEGTPPDASAEAPEAVVETPPVAPSEVAPPGGDAASGLAIPTPPPERHAPPAVDDERPPLFEGPPRSTIRVAPQPTTAVTAAYVPPAPIDVETPGPVVSERFGGRAYPARYARRPLTLGEGVLRIDHGSSGRFGGVSGGGMVIAMTEGLALGVTSDLEIGFQISQVFGNPPVGRDPYLAAAFRYFHDSVVELGVRASVRIPMVTTGDTVLRTGATMVIHGGDWFRLQTALDLDLLFASNVSPLLAIPLQVAFSTGDGFSFGAEGWLGFLNGADVYGSGGGFAQITHRTRVRAIMDARFAVSWLARENALQITTAVTFYPQLW